MYDKGRKEAPPHSVVAYIPAGGYVAMDSGSGRQGWLAACSFVLAWLASYLLAAVAGHSFTSYRALGSWLGEWCSDDVML